MRPRVGYRQKSQDMEPIEPGKHFHLKSAKRTLIVVQDPVFPRLSSHSDTVADRGRNETDFERKQPPRCITGRNRFKGSCLRRASRP